MEATKIAYSNAGDVLIEAYKNHADSIISNNLITFAVRSYENAIEMDSSDVELQIKLVLKSKVALSLLLANMEV